MPRDHDRKIDRVIGARIRQLRNEKGMSQDAFGDLIGVTFQQVQKYENGTNAISSHRIATICKALDIAPDALYGLDQYSTREPIPISAYAMRIAVKLDRLTKEQRRVIAALVKCLDANGVDDDDE